MNTHRNSANKAVKRQAPTRVATAPNQVWTWDVTWLNILIKGQYYKPYLKRKATNPFNKRLNLGNKRLVEA